MFQLFNCEDIVVFHLLNDLAAKLFSKPPAPPLRGSYSYTGVKYGDTVTYYCEPGYELEGNQNLTCGITGEWGQPPCCISEYIARNHTLCYDRS